MKKRLAIFLCLAVILSFGLLASGCGGDDEQGDDKTASGGTIYYLNFKPEVADVYKDIAAAYKEETGVTVNVVTAASGTYEQTLKSEIAKAEAPTIFQINGPRGYQNWKDYCADLSGTELYKHMTDPTLAIRDGSGVYGIPFVIEGYGIIYNDAIMRDYFELKTKKTDVSSMEDIQDFATLKAVVEDMQAQKDALGIKGVFASTSLKSGEDWRWQTHLANIPIYYEFQKNDVDLTGDETREIQFQYDQEFKNIFDLYINNSVTDPKMLGSKQVADSMAEFALGQCAMVQNGNWAWSQIAEVSGNTVKAEDIHFLPIYMGMEGEKDQGLCIGTENFIAVNSQASPEQQKLAEDFLYWLYSSDTGKDFVTNRLEFIAPFDTFNEDDRPSDPLAREVMDWMEREDVHTIPWNFTLFPSQTFKDDFGAVLLQYAQGQKNWDDVKNLVVTQWKSESR
ncbi:ABC transporter substrate-binding protein [Bacilliculturomica massiliensis]|uniref:ABC transporter substrate-binding protein n=1 Tax=Bacilliculturomica massiliensis TaxID=1917867 RepID=UPI0010313C10|nr:ABC transporter substrate-binding protein [Bacilliculturomica massiliensis]